MATLMCILTSDKISIEVLMTLINTVVLEARRRGVAFINIIFYSNSIKDVFKYRDAFTKYIDIGIRIYIEEKQHRLVKILSSCNSIYGSHEDPFIEEFSREINVNIKIV